MARVRRAGTYSTAFSHCPLWSLEGRPPPPRGSAPPTARPGPARPDTSRDRGRTRRDRSSPDSRDEPPRPTGHRLTLPPTPPDCVARLPYPPSSRSFRPPHTRNARPRQEGIRWAAAGMGPRGLQLRRGDRDSLRRQPHGTVDRALSFLHTRCMHARTRRKRESTSTTGGRAGNGARMHARHGRPRRDTATLAAIVVARLPHRMERQPSSIKGTTTLPAYRSMISAADDPVVVVRACIQRTVCGRRPGRTLRPFEFCDRRRRVDDALRSLSKAF